MIQKILDFTEPTFELTATKFNLLILLMDITFNQTVLQPLAAADPEAMRYNPKTESLIWSSEGAVHNGFHPDIHEVTKKGKHVRFILHSKNVQTQ